MQYRWTYDDAIDRKDSFHVGNIMCALPAYCNHGSAVDDAYSVFSLHILLLERVAMQDKAVIIGVGGDVRWVCVGELGDDRMIL